MEEDCSPSLPSAAPLPQISLAPFLGLTSDDLVLPSSDLPLSVRRLIWSSLVRSLRWNVSLHSPDRQLQQESDEEEEEGESSLDLSSLRAGILSLHRQRTELLRLAASIGSHELACGDLQRLGIGSYLSYSHLLPLWTQLLSLLPLRSTPQLWNTLFDSSPQRPIPSPVTTEDENDEITHLRSENQLLRDRLRHAEDHLVRLRRGGTASDTSVFEVRDKALASLSKPSPSSRTLMRERLKRSRLGEDESRSNDIINTLPSSTVPSSDPSSTSLVPDRDRTSSPSLIEGLGRPLAGGDVHSQINQILTLYRIDRLSGRIHLNLGCFARELQELYDSLRPPSPSPSLSSSSSSDVDDEYHYPDDVRDLAAGRIIVIGPKGVGKSSFLNDIFKTELGNHSRFPAKGWHDKLKMTENVNVQLIQLGRQMVPTVKQSPFHLRRKRRRRTQMTFVEEENEEEEEVEIVEIESLGVGVGVGESFENRSPQAPWLVVADTEGLHDLKTYGAEEDLGTGTAAMKETDASILASLLRANFDVVVLLIHAQALEEWTFRFVLDVLERFEEGRYFNPTRSQKPDLVLLVRMGNLASREDLANEQVDWNNRILKQKAFRSFFSTIWVGVVPFQVCPNVNEQEGERERDREESISPGQQIYEDHIRSLRTTLTQIALSRVKSRLTPPDATLPPSRLAPQDLSCGRMGLWEKFLTTNLLQILEVERCLDLHAMKLFGTSRRRRERQFLSAPTEFGALDIDTDDETRAREEEMRRRRDEEVSLAIAKRHHHILFRYLHSLKRDGNENQRIFDLSRCQSETALRRRLVKLRILNNGDRPLPRWEVIRKSCGLIQTHFLRWFTRLLELVKLRDADGMYVHLDDQIRPFHYSLVMFGDEMVIPLLFHLIEEGWCDGVRALLRRDDFNPWELLVSGKMRLSAYGSPLLSFPGIERLPPACFVATGNPLMISVLPSIFQKLRQDARAWDRLEERISDLVETTLPVEGSSREDGVNVHALRVLRLSGLPLHEYVSNGKNLFHRCVELNSVEGALEFVNHCRSNQLNLDVWCAAPGSNPEENPVENPFAWIPSDIRSVFSCSILEADIEAVAATYEISTLITEPLLYLKAHLDALPDELIPHRSTIRRLIVDESEYCYNDHWNSLHLSSEGGKLQSLMTRYGRILSGEILDDRLLGEIHHAEEDVRIVWLADGLSYSRKLEILEGLWMSGRQKKTQAPLFSAIDRRGSEGSVFMFDDRHFVAKKMFCDIKSEQNREFGAIFHIMERHPHAVTQMIGYLETAWALILLFPTASGDGGDLARSIKKWIAHWSLQRIGTDRKSFILDSYRLLPFYAASKAAHCLQSVHHERWTHRDFKVENLLWTLANADLEVFLCDFGSCQMEDEMQRDQVHTHITQRQGRVENATYEHRIIAAYLSDIYCLGIALVHLFHPNSEMEFLYKKDVDQLSSVGRSDVHVPLRMLSPLRCFERLSDLAFTGLHSDSSEKYRRIVIGCIFCLSFSESALEASDGLSSADRRPNPLFQSLDTRRSLIDVVADLLDTLLYHELENFCSRYQRPDFSALSRMLPENHLAVVVYPTMCDKLRELRQWRRRKDREAMVGNEEGNQSHYNVAKSEFDFCVERTTRRLGDAVMRHRARGSRQDRIRARRMRRRRHRT